MKLAVPREVREGETRVALAPESVKKLVSAGYEVGVEQGAGLGAGFSDDEYGAAGAAVGPEPPLGEADLVLKVQAPTAVEVERLRRGATLICGLLPSKNLEVVRALAARGVTALSTDAIPRITRAQSMDTLSAMANIAGYRGALIAALELGKYFPMLMTAAGTVPAARVFVIGAGVAGLQAIATARRLGAHPTATDVRPEVKEQVESVGAKYIGVELRHSASAGGGYAAQLSPEDQARQREMLADHLATVDAVVTTALIGGVFAPTIITAEMVSRMKRGSVIVDVAADGGGNCALSKPGRTVVEHGVRIAAPLNLPAGMATHASLLWSRCLTNLVLAFTKEKLFAPGTEDEIIRGATITRGGEVVHAKTAEALAGA